LPTTLPPPRRVAKKRSPARTVLEFLFNTAMVVSALILTFMVLVREERYASGVQETAVQAIEQSMQQSALDMPGQSRVIPPSN